MRIINKKGFTLIELSVVLAVLIIIIASVFISVSIARKKANTARIKNDLDQIRKFAEVIYAENGMRGYCITGGLCVKGDPRISELTNDIIKRAKKPSGASEAVIVGADTSNPMSYCASAYFADEKNLCLDSAANQTGTVFDNSTSGNCSLLGADYRCQ